MSKKELCPKCKTTVESVNFPWKGTKVCLGCYLTLNREEAREDEE